MHQVKDSSQTHQERLGKTSNGYADERGGISNAALAGLLL